MALQYPIPRADALIVDGRGAPSREWYNFFRTLLGTQAGADADAQIAALAERVAALEADHSTDFTIQGTGSIVVNGTPQGGVVQISLFGDIQSPGASLYYGTNADGEQGWHALEAAAIPYDNTTSGLTAEDVQAAIDETVALIPATTDDLPEGSTNLYFPEAPEDGSNYARKDGAWVSFASGGDVVGPASSPDGDFALFDGATGKLLKDGGAPGGMAFIDDAPSDGTTYGRKDGAWEAVTGGGGGGGSTAWTLLNSWDFATDGAVANIEASLAGYNEVLVVVQNVTLAASGYRGFQVSSNGGTSWQTSYDYLDQFGVRATSSLVCLVIQNTASASSRSGSGQFSLLADAESRVMGNEIVGAANSVLQVPALGSKPNRIRVGGWTSAGATTNMTGGKVFIYGR